MAKIEAKNKAKAEVKDKPKVDAKSRFKCFNKRIKFLNNFFT